MRADDPDPDRDAMALLWRAVRNDVPGHELTQFRSTGGLAVGSALLVYKNGYWIRQHDALRELFPRLERALGAAGFRELVRRYIRAHPSVHPELERIGAALARFMATDSELASLAGVAELEQAGIESFLSRNDSVADIADIRAETFGRSRLRMVASMRIVRLDDVLLHLLARDGMRVIGARAAVISRPRFACATHLISHEELALLSLARTGATIDELLAQTAGSVTGTHELMQRWFSRRWIAAIATEAQ